MQVPLKGTVLHQEEAIFTRQTETLEKKVPTAASEAGASSDRSSDKIDTDTDTSTRDVWR